MMNGTHIAVVTSSAPGADLFSSDVEPVCGVAFLVGDEGNVDEMKFIRVISFPWVLYPFYEFFKKARRSSPHPSPVSTSESESEVIPIPKSPYNTRR